MEMSNFLSMLHCQLLIFISFLFISFVCLAMADLSAVISADRPTLDQWDYGLKMDIDPSAPFDDFVADVKVFSDVEPFKIPDEFEPVSAVYSISLSDTSVKVNKIRIQHCVGDSEQLKKLSFVKTSGHSSDQWEEVAGGTFEKEYGEITPQHMCLWSIVGSLKKCMFISVIMYRTKYFFSVFLFHV